MLVVVLLVLPLGRVAVAEAALPLRGHVGSRVWARASFVCCLFLSGDSRFFCKVLACTIVDGLHLVWLCVADVAGASHCFA